MVQMMLIAKLALADVPLISMDREFSSQITSTVYSPDEKQLEATVLTHFELARTCSHDAKVPSKRTARAIARGLIWGYRRFYSCRYDRVLDCFAYILGETGGNCVDNGKEAGVAGLWIDTGRDAADRYNIPCPKTRYAFKEKLKSDPDWCCYMTVATLSNEAQTDAGDMTRAIAVMEYGRNGFMTRLHAEEKKPMNQQIPIHRWEHVQGWTTQRRWLFCVDEHNRLQSNNICNECFNIQEAAVR